MKKICTPKGLFLLGFALLFLSNAVILGGVWLNRSGGAESMLKLTERELALRNRSYKENSGLSLRISWRALARDKKKDHYSSWRSPAWLDTAKLIELGFNPKELEEYKQDRKRYRRPIPREVYLALEMEGQAYKTAVKRAEDSLEQLEQELIQDPDEKRTAHGNGGTCPRQGGHCQVHRLHHQR